MRAFPVLAVCLIAGCEVATRNETEFEFLGEMEALIAERDRCGLYRLVTTRPGALAGDDALAAELRDFVDSSRGECRPGRSGPDDGGPAWFPDVSLVAAARNQQADAPGAQAVADPRLPPGRLTGVDGERPGAVPSMPPASAGGGRPERAVDGSGPSGSQGSGGSWRQPSEGPGSVSLPNEAQRRDERGRQGGGGSQAKNERGRGEPADGRHDDGGKGRGREKQR
jgi:hypothetical protein